MVKTMDYQAKILHKTLHTDQLVQIFLTEDKEFQERASYDLKKEKDGISFSIQAKDAASLRAAFNAITKTLMIFEKTKELSKTK
jgi:tRNA threonylcarbamoyladenosine modification (KEOPS) complex  Pcc1 subunit